MGAEFQGVTVTKLFELEYFVALFPLEAHSKLCKARPKPATLDYQSRLYSRNPSFSLSFFKGKG